MIAATTGGPKVRFGTNRPSITSTWTRSAPPSAAIARASARRAKSAARKRGGDRTRTGAHRAIAAANGIGRARDTVTETTSRRGQGRAGGRKLLQDRVRRHAFVRLEARAPDAKAVALEPRADLLGVLADEVGHDVARFGQAAVGEHRDGAVLRDGRSPAPGSCATIPTRATGSRYHDTAPSCSESRARSIAAARGATPARSGEWSSRGPRETARRE